MKTLYFSSLILRSFFILLLIKIFILPSHLYSQNPEWIVYHPSNCAIPDSMIVSLAIDSLNNIWVGTTTKGLAKFDGKDWTIYPKTASLPGRFISDIQFDKKGNAWIGTNPFTYFPDDGGLSKFDGSNWTVFSTVNSDIPTNHVSCIAFDDEGDLWIGSSDIGVVHYNGSTWTTFNTSNSPIPRNKVNTIAFQGLDYKWIGTGSLSGEGMAVFSGLGLGWKTYNTSNSDLPSDDIYTIVVGPNNNKWIGTSGNGLVKFDGSNFTVYNTSNSPLLSDYIWTLTFDKQGNLWVGMGVPGGIAKFDGQNWTLYSTSNSGLPKDAVSKIAFDDWGNMWLGTYGGVAVYKEGGVILSNKVSGKSQVSQFHLSQNYPNPFNPSTKIKFSLPKPESVKIEICNIRGQKIQTLLNKQMSAGNHEVEFGGHNLASGIYLYRIEAGKWIDMKKMILIK